jgi:hypothetical protein
MVTVSANTKILQSVVEQVLAAACLEFFETPFCLEFWIPQRAR